MATADEVQAVLEDGTLTRAERELSLATLRRRAFLELQAALPITVGKVTVASIDWVDGMLIITGTGGRISWPVRVVRPPLLDPDPTGPIVRADGQRFRVAPLASLRSILRAVTR